MSYWQSSTLICWRKRVGKNESGRFFGGELGFPFLCNTRMYQNIRAKPLIMLEILMAHQMPNMPKALSVDNAMAAGMREPVNTIPTTDGGTVLPMPLKAPRVIISMIMKTWETAKILR